MTKSVSWVIVGKFSKPFGLIGQVKVLSFCETPADLMNYNPLLIEGTENPVFFSWANPKSSVLIAKLANINNKEVAGSLNGKKIFANRENFTDLPDHEYYFSDLVNCLVYDTDQKIFGKILGIHNFGAGDLLEISKFEDNSSIMVLFNEMNFPTVDIFAKKLILNPPQ